MLVLLYVTVLSFKSIVRFFDKYEAQSKYHSAGNPVKRLLSVLTITFDNVTKSPTQVPLCSVVVAEIQKFKVVYSPPIKQRVCLNIERSIDQL